MTGQVTARGASEWLSTGYAGWALAFEPSGWRFSTAPSPSREDLAATQPEVTYRGNRMRRAAQREFQAFGWWWAVVFIDGDDRLCRSSEMPGPQTVWRHVPTAQLAKLLEDHGC